MPIDIGPSRVGGHLVSDFESNRVRVGATQADSKMANADGPWRAAGPGLVRLLLRRRGRAGMALHREEVVPPPSRAERKPPQGHQNSK